MSLPAPTGIGVGNMFSFWLWAHHGRLIGQDRWVRRTDAMNPWLAVFPDLRPLVIEESNMRLRDQRDRDWYQDFDRFPRSHLESFIRNRLLSSPTLPIAPGEHDVVTVNVRRGDYYTDPQLRQLYGFDIASYVRIAMDGSAAQAPIKRVDVVSDDPDWCRSELGFLNEYGPVRYQLLTDGPIENLGQLASARRLVLANSTFSYWGAYLSNVHFEDNYSMIWAPEFHRRDVNNGRAWQLDPRWSVVRDRPLT
ncbi:alpha-1,2-fucosyltransferase [Calidifontibacter terrae]